MAAVRLLAVVCMSITIMALSSTSMFSDVVAVSTPGKQSPVTITMYFYIRNNKNYIQMANVTTSTGESMVLHSVGLPVMSSANVSTATVVGHARGLTIQTSGGDSGGDREQIFETIEYSDGVFNGTLAFHGQISFPPVEGDEVAVVGGTGSFRRATGYAIPTVVSSLMYDPIVLRWKVHIFFPHMEH